jgi:hypothetical protein
MLNSFAVDSALARFALATEMSFTFLHILKEGICTLRVKPVPINPSPIFMNKKGEKRKNLKNPYASAFSSMVKKIYL